MSETIIIRTDDTPITLSIVGPGAGLAVDAAQRAETSATRAEDARDGAEVAAASVGVYPTQAAGLAATTPGQSFYVAQGGTLKLYLNSAGSAVEQAEVLTPSSAAISDRPTFADLSADTGGSLLGLIQTGAGAAARTALDRALDIISVRDFGARGDGVSDDTLSFEAAATEADARGGGMVFVPSGTYVLDGVSLAGLSYILWMGAGARVKGPSSRVHSYFDCTGANNISFSGLIFDQMRASLPVYTSGDYANGPLNVPIYVKGSGGGLVIDDCDFLDLYTSAIYFDAAQGLTVRDCRFSSGAQTQNQWTQHIHLQTASDILVSGCRVQNAAITDPSIGVCGLYASGVRRLVVENAFFDYCGRNNAGSHRVGALDCYGDVTDVSLVNCVFTNCMASAVRLNAAAFAVAQGCRFQLNANAESGGNAFEITGSIIFGGNKGTSTVRVVDCVFQDPGSRAAVTVLVASYDWGAPSKNVTIRGCTFDKSVNSVRIFGPFEGVRIEGNRASGGRGAVVVVPGTGITSTLGAEADSSYRRLSILGNEIIDDEGVDANAILVTLGNATAAWVDEINISGNSVRSMKSGSGSAAVGIQVQLNSDNRARTRSRVAGNFIDRYQYSIDVRQHGYSEVRGNRATGPGGMVLLSSSDMTNVLSRENFANGAAVAETPLAV